MANLNNASTLTPLTNITNLLANLSTTVATTMNGTLFQTTTTNPTQAKSTGYSALPWLNIISITLFSIIMVLGVLGNSIVVYVYGVTSRKRFLKFERLMLILGIVDLLSSIVNPLIYIYFNATEYKAWHFGSVGCNIIPAIGPVLTNVSLGIILIMAIDRDRAVTTPFKKQISLPVIYKAIGITLVLSTLVFVPYMHHLNVQSDGSCTVRERSGGLYYKYTVSMLCISDALFFFIFLHSSIRVCLKLKSKSSVGGDGSFDTGAKKERQKETNRIVRLIIAMGVTFSICIYPRDLLHIVFYISRMRNVTFSNMQLIRQLNGYLKVLHTANSVVNVFLYSFMNSQFRKEVTKLMSKYRFTGSFVKKFKIDTTEMQSGNTGSTTGAHESQDN